MTLTFFTVPKPFVGDIGRIQRNAIRSWKALESAIDVILLGDEPGIEEAARAFGCRHIKPLAKNRFGTPLVSDAFQRAEHESTADILCFIHTDIILLPDFLGALDRCRRLQASFLMIGRRTDVEVQHELDTAAPAWHEEVRALAKQRGVLYPTCGVDYFAYSRGVYRDIPPFAIGRMAFDNWLIFAGVDAGAAVVDATAAVLAVHQHHEAAPPGARAAVAAAEIRENTRLTGVCGFGCDDSTHLLTAHGIVRRSRASVRRRVERGIAHYPYLRPLLTPFLYSIRAANRAQRAFSAVDRRR